MPIRLDGLPYDILFYVTSHLEVNDIVSLGHSCRQLKGLLHESTLCRRTIENHVRYTREAKPAQEHDHNIVENQSQGIEISRPTQDSQSSYCEALKNIYERRHALSNGIPFSARIVGQGHGFCYRQGVLCILQGNIIRVSDEHISSETLEIDISPYITSSEVSSSASEYTLTLLHYSDEIITVHHERKIRPNNSRILALSTRAETSGGDRLIKEVPLTSSYKLFSRHNAQWLYYGTYSALALDGHHEWEVQGVSLNDNSQSIPAISLEGFFGTDIGSTIAFEIHDGDFLAVSNQTSFDVEEIDWTSFYHCIRFPLDQPGQNIEVNKKVYRRQHKEGPIHDSWTELTLQIDERTNKPMIVESRREWVGSSSKQARTFYIKEFDTNETPRTELPEHDLPQDDLYTTVLDDHSKPNYAPYQSRTNYYFHPENPPGSDPPRSFILARTKFKNYNLSSNTFLDLVEDDRCCPNSPTGPCLRLRVGSRRVAPLDWTPQTSPSLGSPSSAYTPSEHPADYLGRKGDVVYRHSSIRMWPRPAKSCACSKRLHNILNPPLPSGPSYSRYVTGCLDDRALVYMLKSGRSYGPGDDGALGVIVMVCFDRCENLGRGSEGNGADGASSYWQWEPGVCRNGICR
ncbi:hypothetical protein P280DRAFT_221736 [Massarina eburnea CBS 473.64]|uniref:F-box domain-containing protein n=1 Tax=Massarina eburnea CBS 473.64 TaxID=1395130 RepID=A0A6A6SCN3_9PLEO|nr:hypothetical protein P280DRAFT_221736 [Massarina eburnea CBS 473.64]